MKLNEGDFPLAEIKLDEASTTSDDIHLQCNLIKVSKFKNMRTIAAKPPEIGGEKDIDEEGDYALEDEAHDEEIRVWLRKERAIEV